MENKDPNILSYEEMADILHDKMVELADQIERSNKLQTKHNNTLTVLLSIKEAYPHEFVECVTSEMMDKICGKE
jgi:hypothetical protein